MLRLFENPHLAISINTEKLNHSPYLIIYSRSAFNEIVKFSVNSGLTSSSLRPYKEVVFSPPIVSDKIGFAESTGVLVIFGNPAFDTLICIGQ